MSDSLHVDVDVHQWGSLSNETRSFINFFMKNAALYLSIATNPSTGNEEAFSGHIRWPYRTFALSSDSSTSLSYNSKAYFIDLPYINVDSSNTAQSQLNNASLINNIHPVVSTKLGPATSRLCYLEHDSSSHELGCGGDPIHPKVTFDGEIISNDIVLQPYVNNIAVDSNGPDYRPTSMTNNQSVVQIKRTADFSFETRFQYKTTPFKVTMNSVEQELRYYVGCLPIGSTTADDISDYLISGNKSLFIGESSVENSPCIFFVGSSTTAPSSTNIEYVNVNNNVYCQEDILSNLDTEPANLSVLPSKSVFMVKTDEDKQFFMYVSLYDTEDNEVTVTDIPSNWSFYRDGSYITNTDPNKKVDVFLDFEDIDTV